VLVSGCRARETSADAEIGDRFNGALTYYLLKTLFAPNGMTQPIEEVVARTRALLQQNGYPQHAQLEGSADLMSQAFLTLPRKKAIAA
jgi:metacaspase-1